MLIKKKKKTKILNNPPPPVSPSYLYQTPTIELTPKPPIHTRRLTTITDTAQQFLNITRRDLRLFYLILASGGCFWFRCLVRSFTAARIYGVYSKALSNPTLSPSTTFNSSGSTPISRDRRAPLFPSVVCFGHLCLCLRPSLRLVVHRLVSPLAPPIALLHPPQQPLIHLQCCHFPLQMSSFALVLCFGLVYSYQLERHAQTFSFACN